MADHPLKILMVSAEMVPFAKTGGLADVIAGETDAIDVVEPLLTLEGLRIMHGLNYSE